MAAALGLPAKLICGFVDEDINNLLGVDVQREVALTLLAAGHSDAPAPAPPPMLALDLDGENVFHVEYQPVICRHISPLVVSR